MAKTWVKLYTNEWLHGSIRVDLTPAERSVWADLLALAGLSRREGYLEYSEGLPYSEDDLVRLLNVSSDLVKSTIEKCTTEGRLSYDGDNTLTIVNWTKYQFVPTGKERMVETEQERTLREQRELSRLSRKYPDLAVSRETFTTIDKETGEVLETQVKSIKTEKHTKVGEA